MKKMYSASLLNTKTKLLAWANQFNTFVLLDSNGFTNEKISGPLGTFDMILAADATSEISPAQDSFNVLDDFIKNRYAFGFLTYDLKDQLEHLQSNNFDGLEFPPLHFFEPAHLIGVNSDGSVELIHSAQKSAIEDILNQEFTETPRKLHKIQSRITREEYLSLVEKIRQHILRGDIYEMNFCQEFYVEDAVIDPITTYLDLTTTSPTPFACFYKHRNRFLLSASPERFLLKNGRKIISQPIKGTIKRGKSKKEDMLLKDELKNNLKEQAENVMIVDLVRNDLSKVAKDGSVCVTELFGIYPFRQVFQMISTVEAEVNDDISPVNVIKEAFPMGSMTGAPKVRAMQLIEEYESTKRGLYSGAVGYFTPNGDFDFNVVIRSILYNRSKKYLSFSVGSAITFGSVAEAEYDECLIKAKAIRKVLNWQ